LPQWHDLTTRREAELTQEEVTGGSFIVDSARAPSGQPLVGESLEPYCGDPL
jgi:hypothetical protein